MKAKKLMAIAFFLIPLIADLFIPGSGLVIELALLIWELLQTEEDDLKRSL
ncbi:hypothetical protein IQ244_16970 [Nostoc sp. LEGE 06077]|uniref:hypothetical protein n=1 Tax=Nostoc TaxID=1177 RepID=UPI001650EC9C|nr:MULTISPECIES: hypothetical protein [Nostoc]MBE9208189.1 hypothetical protein [Nostoc sp. LEGE 06077]